MLHHVNSEVVLPHELLSTNSTFELVMNGTMFRALSFSWKRFETEVAVNGLKTIKNLIILQFLLKI